MPLYNPSSTVGQFNVKTYGAAGDGVTDDTAAIKSAQAAAVAWATSTGTMTADIYYPPGTYLVGGSPVQGGSTKGNAQIPQPVIATTGQSLVIKHHGPVAGVKPLHWLQTTAQTAGGAVLVSTSTAPYSATYGQPSVIGGPTPEQGYGRTASLFSNVLVEIDNLSIILPDNPSISGVDMTGCAGYRIGTLSVKTNAVPGSITLPTTTTQFGVRCADNNNNDSAWIDDLTVYGCNYALIANEHLVARRVTAIYNIAAVEVGVQDMAHGARIDYLSVENCNVGIGTALGSFPVKLDVGQMDWENPGGGWWAVFAAINDPSGLLVGTINVTDIGLSPHLTYTTGTGTYSVRGPASGANVRVYDMTRQSGAVAGADVPVPASATATVNPVCRDASVTLTGGTVSDITVDGQSLGITSGTFIVPTCRPVTLTYTVAPTWKWTIL